MTRLEAVNEILERAGLAAVGELQTGTASVAAKAEKQLDASSQKIQGEGWHFNTTRNELVPLTGTELIVPDGTLKIDTAGYSGHINVSVRGNRLYNNDTNSFDFASELRCTITSYFDWGCIPFQVRRYIMLDAAKQFNSKYGHRHADQREKRANAQYIEDELIDARREAHRYSERQDNTNILNSPSARSLRGETPRYFGR
jgi:hypothetical protein